MIVTVTPNPALDVTISVDDLRVGSSHRIPLSASRAGGKGVNVARVLAQQGLASLVVAPVGGDAGAVFAADLDAAGIDRMLVAVERPTRSTYTVVTPTSTTNLNETGHALPDDAWRRLVEAATSRLDGASVLVCSGSLPPETPEDLCADLVRAAHAAGALAIVDAHGPHLLAAVRAGADVVKPNADELLATMGGDDVVAAARALARLGAGLVVASLGADGMLAVPADGPVLRARLDALLAGNATGAGDAAVAAIAASLAAGRHDPAELLLLATAWSAAAVLEPLAGTIADPAPLERRITITQEPA